MIPPGAHRRGFPVDVRWRFGGWRCALGLHPWGWPGDVELFGHRHAVQFCERCPAVRWLGKSQPI